MGEPKGVLPEEVYEAYRRVFAEKIAEICRGKKPHLTLGYHTVKGKDYPCLVVHCKRGRGVKIHISQDKERLAYIETQRIRLEKILKALEKFGKVRLVPELALQLVEFLKKLKELERSPQVWEFLFRNKEQLPPDFFPRFVFEAEREVIELWDIEGLKELRLYRKLRTGELIDSISFEYRCKEKGKKEHTYLLELEPLKVLKITELGIHINNRWIVKRIEREKLYINL